MLTLRLGHSARHDVEEDASIGVEQGIADECERVSAPSPLISTIPGSLLSVARSLGVSVGAKVRVSLSQPLPLKSATMSSSNLPTGRSRPPRFRRLSRSLPRRVRRECMYRRAQLRDRHKVSLPFQTGRKQARVRKNEFFRIIVTIHPPERRLRDVPALSFERYTP
jgi:hypothetical protein